MQGRQNTWRACLPCWLTRAQINPMFVVLWQNMQPRSCLGVCKHMQAPEPLHPEMAGYPGTTIAHTCFFLSKHTIYMISTIDSYNTKEIQQSLAISVGFAGPKVDYNIRAITNNNIFDMSSVSSPLWWSFDMRSNARWQSAQSSLQGLMMHDPYHHHNNAAR